MYPGSNAFDNYRRLSLRAVNQAEFNDRYTPYGYYDQSPFYDTGLERHERSRMQTIINGSQEHGRLDSRGRKRIAVACCRCRKRKIKCSGDPGNGAGCQACRNAGGPEGEKCQFLRVGALSDHEIPQHLHNADAYEANEPHAPLDRDASTHNSAYDNDLRFDAAEGDAKSTAGSNGEGLYMSHRPSLPSLPFRSMFPSSYTSENEASSLTQYAYPTPAASRHDYITNGYHLGDYRSWGSIGSGLPPPSASSYYEPTSTYSFGSIQAIDFPHYPMTSVRLPSVTAESIAAMGLSEMHASLPANTAHERHLPFPCTHASHYQHQGRHEAFDSRYRPGGPLSDAKVPMGSTSSITGPPTSFDGAPANVHGNYCTVHMHGVYDSSTASTFAHPTAETTLGYHYPIPTEPSGLRSIPLPAQHATPFYPPAVTTSGPISPSTLPFTATSSTMLGQDRQAATTLPTRLPSYSREAFSTPNKQNGAVDRSDSSPVNTSSAEEIESPLARKKHNRHSSNCDHHKANKRQRSREKEQASNAHRMSLAHLNDD